MDERYKGVGQPSKIYREGVTLRFLHAIEKGATYAIACGFAGIGYNTFNEWRKRAEGLLNLTEEELATHPDKAYVDFYWRVKEVECFAAMKWLDKIESAANIHWQAAAWKLERRHPEEYAKPEKDKPQENDTSLVDKARSDALKLQEDKHGRSSSTES
jgi:hypothetical protein